MDNEQIELNPGQRCRSLKFACSDVEALTELWLTGLCGFIELYRAIPESALTKAFDAEGTRAVDVGRHVMESASLDVSWCLQTAGVPELPSREAKPALETRSEVLGEASVLFSIVPDALAVITSDQLYRQGKSSMTPEIILEHSIVHFHRHCRQLRVRLLEPMGKDASVSQQ